MSNTTNTAETFARTNAPLIVNYGMGVDSTAMLVGLQLRGIVPDLIIFADTGSEKPETYAYLAHMDAWLASVGFPTVTVVKYRPTVAEYDTLEANMVINETIPSMAYGRGKCSQKFKAEVMDHHIKGANRGVWKGAGWAPYHTAHAGLAPMKAAVVAAKAQYEECVEELAIRTRALKSIKGRSADVKTLRDVAKELVDTAAVWTSAARTVVAAAHAELSQHLPTKYIGYDDSTADRKRTKRVQDNFDLSFNFAYPLQAWGWTRPQCIAEIEKAGLPVPLKSACFFCPASHKWEIRWLAARHPELFLRAIAMEDGNTNGRHAAKVNPEGKIGCGLGMKFRWRTFAETEGFLSGSEIIGNASDLMAQAMADKPAYEANSDLPCTDGMTASSELITLKRPAREGERYF